VGPVSSPSRLRALRPFLLAAVVPLVLAVLVMGPRLGGMLGVMWAVLLLTAGLAATSRRPERPSTYHPRGRLHG
jgi:hypothetical protein